jgi:hypothetical protein
MSETITETRNSKPRITFEVTQEQYDVLKQHLERGFQKKVFSIVVDDIVEMLKQYGPHFVAALLRKEATYKEMMCEYMSKLDN